MKRDTGLLFMVVGIISLLMGLGWGIVGAFQFLFPEGAVNHLIPFYKSRPLHVSHVVAWIILSATGGVYYYLPKITGRNWYSDKLMRVHFWLFTITGIAIMICFLLGIFGGREYLEFPYYFVFPILLGWFLFAINFFKTAKLDFFRMPVYLWMWATGCLFMIFTLTEAYLWLIPFFRNNVIRDLTVQWKSYGAFIGAWNMFIYGTASYVMCRISKSNACGEGKMVFFLYFIGLSNMLFNWGHHTYIVPASSWIKHISYGVSMVELIILGKIIWEWKSTLEIAQKHFHHLAYRFLLASEFWIFLNLILAMLISVPALNLYTHGTHMTVAHAMGTTIGINTMILLASLFYIITERNREIIQKYSGSMEVGFWITQISLFIFWVMLIAAGARKGYLAYFAPEMNFKAVLSVIRPYLLVFSFAGIGLLTGFSFILLPLLKEWKAWTGKR